MRYLILSDIHSNSEALRAVLDRAEGLYDQVLCLGDIVGYGADPNAVAGWVRQHAWLTVRGNHDRACTGLDDLEWFNPAARQSALWTQLALSPENVTWLRGLTCGPVCIDRFQIMHGSPLDEDEYIINVSDVAPLSGFLDARISFFGHTHLQGGFILRENRIERIAGVPLKKEQFELNLRGDDFYLINPGAVGQPRDGDPRAACAIYDPEECRVVYHRIPYDIGTAQRKIIDAGLPGMLAVRLLVGR